MFNWWWLSSLTDHWVVSKLGSNVTIPFSFGACLTCLEWWCPSVPARFSQSARAVLVELLAFCWVGPLDFSDQVSNAWVGWSSTHLCPVLLLARFRSKVDRLA